MSFIISNELLSDEQHLKLHIRQFCPLVEKFKSPEV